MRDPANQQRPHGMQTSRPLVLLLLIALCAALTPVAAVEPPALDANAQAALASAAADPGPTPAERADLHVSPTWEETIAYLREVAAACPHVEVTSFGYSTEGRPLPLVLVRDAATRNDPPGEARPKPVILVTAGIHSGEICGNDAIQLLLRDIARGLEPDVVAHLDLLLVPIFNIDGHVRRDPSNRLTQVGPIDGFGTRRNAVRLDLNRDFAKLETPECQALVRLASQFQPHIYVDLHTNDGFDHQYELTFSAAVNPSYPGRRDALVRGALVPHILERMTAADHPAQIMGYPDDEFDLTQGISAFGIYTRYSTGYFETRQTITILSEAHPYVPYDRRVLATRELLGAILEFAVRQRIELVEAVGDARKDALRWAWMPGEHEIALGCTADTTRARVIPFLGKAFDRITSPITGRDYARYRRERVLYEVPFREHYVPVAEATMPRGYLIERPWGAVAATLRRHAIEVQTLTAPFRGRVEVTDLTDVQFENRSYQGHHRIKELTTHVAIEEHTFPAGTYWVPLDQAAGLTAMHLLEAESPNGLLIWNAFDTIFERGIVVEDWAVEEMAWEMLKEPGIRAAYHDALQDSAFAADPDARLDFFFQRSPYADEHEGRYPVYRLMSGEVPASVR
jgi:hypothetical protein